MVFNPHLPPSLKLGVVKDPPATSASGNASVIAMQSSRPAIAPRGALMAAAEVHRLLGHLYQIHGHLVAAMADTTTPHETWGRLLQARDETNDAHQLLSWYAVGAVSLEPLA